ncbi:MAG TPA: histidine phosphatase family protein, partial [Rhodoglobus sp.]|nr:histidine phosphatase family protein [Rhodoglobus sp.]HQE46758.1 histidine phosphatase family protein [Rhodoglobus sp.]
MAHYLYLVRHGEQQDAEHGLPDGPLSPKGQRQARAIADRLGGVPFSRAWHSPLERAAQTAA